MSPGSSACDLPLRVLYQLAQTLSSRVCSLKTLPQSSGIGLITDADGLKQNFWSLFVSFLKEGRFCPPCTSTSTRPDAKTQRPCSAPGVLHMSADAEYSGAALQCVRPNRPSGLIVVRELSGRIIAYKPINSMQEEFISLPVLPAATY